MFRKKIILIILLFSLLIVGSVFSYGNKKTHPKLTQAIAEFYNQRGEHKLTDQQIEWMRQGSVKEDEPVIRCVNHYYNPINNIGLSDKIYEYVPNMAAPDWANSSAAQSIGIFQGDYSWQTAIYNYQQANYEKAFLSLGHVLHLLEDMAVPAHTRDDAHEEGDVYEKWAEDNYNKIDVNLDQAAWKNCGDNQECFKLLALYSNENFFSKDTINLDKPKVEIEYLYKNGIKVAFWDKNNNRYLLDNQVHQSYWNHLAPMAVGYGAGIIELFFKGVEKEKIEKPQTALESVIQKLKDTGAGIKTQIAGGWQSVIKSYQNISSNISSPLAGTTEIAPLKQAADAGGKVLSAIENPISTEDLFAPQKAKSAEDNGAFAGQPEQEKVEVLSSEYSEDQNRFKTNALSQENSKIAVSYVIDGDTIVLTTGEKVRYIGIDTPELNNDGAQDDECLAWAARLRNMELLEKGELKLVKDPAVDKDQYGRLLRYVYSGDVFINEQLGREGLAEEFFCKSGWQNCPITADQSRQEIIQKAVDSAEQNKRGLFSGVCEPEKKEDESENKNKETGAEQIQGGNSAAKSNSSGQASPFVFGIGSPAPQSPAGGGAQSNEQLENGQSEDEDSQSSSNAASSSIVLDITAPMEIIKTAADHAVISEVRIDGEEFMELYNPIDNDVDMTGWHLCYYSSGRDWNDPYRSKPFLDNAIIKSKRYYLIAIVNSELSGADWNLDYTSHFLSNTAGSIAIFPFDPAEKTAQEAENGKIDAVGWGNVSYVKESNPSIAPNINQSIERKAFATSTAELMSNDGDHEWLGNAYDTDNNLNDFIIRLAPDAQNFSSQTEPYEKPLIRPDKISDLTIQRIYTKGKSIKLYWTSPDGVSLSEGAYYDMRYKEKNGAECDIGADWDNAYQVSTSTLPAPFNAFGIINTKKITGLQIDTDYCFAVKTFNGEAWSDISNIASGKTLPAFLACSEIPIDADGGILISELTADSSPYCVNNRFFRNRFFKIKAGNKLIVEPGVVIKFQNNTGLIVEGELIAEGSLGQPIAFTSYNDNEKQGAYGIETPADGDWGAIRVVNGGKLTMDNVIVNYGGNYQTGDFFIAMMMIAWLDAGAIVVENGEVNIVNSIISHNTIGAEINGDNSVVNITNSQIFSNQSGGIINYASSTVNAVNNWWGDNSGPYHETLNPNGLGDSVSGNILFDPWIGK